jgi:hypothetical protein
MIYILNNYFLKDYYNITMSGQFTKSFDDDCKIISRVKESHRPGQYALNTIAQSNCGNCMNPYGSVPNAYWNNSLNRNIVDAESVLLQHSYPTIGCGRDRIYLLNTNERNVDLKPFCNKFLIPEDTLLSFPKDYYRELQIDRFYDLQRPQESFVHFDFSQNTRQISKDTFIQRMPTPISVNPSLPNLQRSYKNNM